MCEVHFAVQESFLYFKPFKDVCIGVHSAACFPQAMRTVLAVAVVVEMHVCCRNDSDMICVGNNSQLLLDGKHGLLVVLCAVERLFTVVVWILTQVLIGGGVLVVQDDNAALSFAVSLFV